MDNDQSTALAEQPETSGGFMTKRRDNALSPALMAEQQRAKSEIEAALTIAANMPRDEKRCMDGVLVSCQRKGLAFKSQYQFSRGGSDISGASIVLMEAIAQRWGNLDFGFRELARYPGQGGRPGESIVEAYAWDLETNLRRRVAFTIEHAMGLKGGRKKVLTDPRDIYEWIANQAQRRVRTCLENVIPRDIVDAACEECDKTLKASIDDMAKATADMLKAFAQYGVTCPMIEDRIQRRIDAITPAQIIGLRKIYTSLKDEMSEAGDWFTMQAGDPEPTKSTAAEKAKEALRKQKPAKAKPAKKPAQAPAAETVPAEQPAAPDPMPAPSTEPEPAPPTEPADEPESAPAAETATKTEPAPAERSEVDEQVEQWFTDLEQVNTVRGLNDALTAIPAAWPEEARKRVADAIGGKIEAIRAHRGEGSNQPQG